MKLYRLHRSEWEAGLKARDAVRGRRKREGVSGIERKKSGRRKKSKKGDTGTQTSKSHLLDTGASGTTPEPFNVMLQL